MEYVIPGKPPVTIQRDGRFGVAVRHSKWLEWWCETDDEAEVFAQKIATTERVEIKHLPDLHPFG